MRMRALAGLKRSQVSGHGQCRCQCQCQLRRAAASQVMMYSNKVLLQAPLLALCAALAGVGQAAPAPEGSLLAERLANGLEKTPALGWNSWVCV